MTAPQISIETLPEFLGRQQGLYAFSYTITMRNDSQQTVTLEDRHWIITHGDGHTEEVRGPGVVGEFPTLAPGQAFRYTSGAVLRTAFGSMRGSYGFRVEGGERFRAPIGEFVLNADDGGLH
ncbi:MAG: Co2+/Mg2+ efflux protein ApaG [Xanthomonadales bacterium]|nr:Co2+/Mg2+ efflux protein ApaG [Xanthomonadales bacterium]